MVAESITDDVLIWAISFAFGSISAWLVWLTFRHYNYTMPVYRRMTGDQMTEGYVDKTRHKFEDLEENHDVQRAKLNTVERKVDHVDDRVDHVERRFEDRFDRVEDKVDSIVDAVVPKEKQSEFRPDGGTHEEEEEVAD